MSGPENIPRPDNRCVHRSLLECGFTFSANSNIAFHNGRRLRDAQINEVLNAGLSGSLDCAESGDAIDHLKLRLLGGAGMRDSDELYKGVRRLDLSSVRRRIKRIANDRFAAAGRQLVSAARANQCSNAVSASR